MMRLLMNDEELWSATCGVITVAPFASLPAMTNKQTQDRCSVDLACA